MFNTLYETYKHTLDKAQGSKPKRISYPVYKEKWESLGEQLCELQISYSAFFEFLIQYYGIKLFPNVLFSEGNKYYKCIELYLHEINSESLILEEEQKELKIKYQNAYVRTCLLYSVLKFRHLKSIDPEDYDNSAYNAMTAFSPILITYLMTQDEEFKNQLLTTHKDNNYYTFISTMLCNYGHFEYTDKLLYMDLQEVQTEYLEAYKILTRLADQVVTVEQSPYLIGDIGNGTLDALII